jgi:mannose-1-phosphate guanylyltransferase
VHAVVLVGGFGTRLRPLTNDVPKPMLPILHRPMIVRMADRLAAAGVTDLVLALGFKPEPFAAAFPDGRHDGLRVHYAVEPEPLDTAGAIAFAARECGVDDTFLVANGDVECDVDLAALVQEHRRLGGSATIHLTPVADPSSFGVVELSADGTVERFVEKPRPGETDSNLINAGTYVLEPSVLDRIAPMQRVSIERDTFPSLVSDRQLAAVATHDYWLDTGRPELYLRANLDLIDGTRARASGDHTPAVHPAASVAASASVDASVIGEGARVGDDAVVERSVLLPGAVVEAGARVVDSIVAGAVGAGAAATRAVLGARGHLEPGGELSDGRLPAPE